MGAHEQLSCVDSIDFIFCGALRLGNLGESRLRELFLPRLEADRGTLLECIVTNRKPML